MFAAVETDIVHHRTARWEKDSQRKPGKPASQPDSKPASQAEQSRESRDGQ